MDTWKKYLFASHPEQELREWAQRLKLFRFFRAYGGHAGDGDSLDAAFVYDNDDDLLKFFEYAGHVPHVYKAAPPQPESGKEYSYEEYSRFPSLIDGSRYIQQPGHCEIFGHKIFIWCAANIIKISASGGNYEVTEDHVRIAEELEEKLCKAPLLVKDPPADTKNYICPRYYPDFFQ